MTPKLVFFQILASLRIILIKMRRNIELDLHKFSYNLITILMLQYIENTVSTSCNLYTIALF